jgi:hypothetical protein
MEARQNEKGRRFETRIKLYHMTLWGQFENYWYYSVLSRFNG